MDFRKRKITQDIAAMQKACWLVGYGPKEYGQYLLNKSGYSHKRTNKKNR